MKKRCCYLAVFLVFILLSGCGDKNLDENTNTKANTETTEQGAVILTYGYIDAYSFQDLDSSVQERIVSFNKSQDEYYIEVVKYGQDDYADGLKALNADISAGKGPDIIEITDTALLRQLGMKGVLDDLYAYMEKGEWPRQEDFVENILPCFETKGKLYGLTPFFKILSVIGNPNYIQSEQITFAQLKQLYEENKDNEDVTVWNALAKYSVLGRCIAPSIGRFVNLENQSCDFLNPEFQELLEFSAQFNDGYDTGASDVEDMVRVQEGKMILYYNGAMGNFREYTRYRELSGENGLLIGFPSIEGCSPEITVNFPFLCINTASKHKDAAWQFLCTFLEEGYLSNPDNINSSKGFPVTKRGFESAAKKTIDMTKDASGEGSASDTGGVTVIYPFLPTTQEDVDYITEIIGRIKPRPEYYSEIEEIIMEEIGSYWNGSKTVQEVMEIIQNRSQLYLDEGNMVQ